MKKKTGRMIHMHRKLTEKFQKEWEGKKETSLQSWRMKKRGRKKKRKRKNRNEYKFEIFIRNKRTNIPS